MAENVTEKNTKIIPKMPDNFKPNGYNWADEVKFMYADWCSTPDTERQPPDKQSFAEYYKIPYSTLIGWDNSPEHQNLVRAYIRKCELNFAPIVAKSIRDNAIEGSAKHAELHLRHLSMIWNDANMEVNVHIGTQSDSIGALEEGRLAEQLGGILEHLKRAETAIDADYAVLGTVTDSQTDTQTDPASQPVSHPGTDAASDIGM